MRFTDEVNVPESLLEALQQDRLVLFIGAGVSVDLPSALPTFETLASRVESYFCEPRQLDYGSTPPMPEPIDRFLGRLKSKEKAVESFIYSQLDNASTRPNDWHKAIVHLFGPRSILRIVTTNLDRHLTTLIHEERGETEDIFYAPALPLGDHFHGLVYLHGSVTRPVDCAVLTDSSFGRAYLIDGWASRFLKGLFESFTILFVGYSHEDPVMRYLARGLSVTCRRFALSPDSDADKWRFLGVEPVSYPQKSDNDHHAALCALQAWGKHAGYGYLEYEQVIREIAVAQPPISPIEVDCTLHTLGDPVTARMLFQHIRSIDWFKWLSERDVLKPLFNPTTPLTLAEDALAWWLADNFVVTNHEPFMNLLTRNERIHPVLWRAIAHRLWTAEVRPEPRILALWVNYLLNSAPSPLPIERIFEYLLAKLDITQDRAVALQLYAYLSTPHVRFAQGVVSMKDSTWQTGLVPRLTLRGAEDDLTEIWRDKFRPQLGDCVEQLQGIVYGNLLMAYTIAASIRIAGESYDSVSALRSAIEPHAQDDYRHELDPLIDAARDVMRHYTTHDPHRAILLIDAWYASSVPLLMRIAIDGLTELPTLTPDAKLLWLLDRHLLFALPTHHEVYRLLAQTVSIASEETIATLVRVALEGPPETVSTAQDQEIHDYSKFNLLGWMRKHAPDSASICTALATITDIHPEFRLRSWADFLHYTGDTDDRLAEQPPVPNCKLESLSDDDLYAVVSTRYLLRSPEWVRRNHLLAEIQSNVSQHFDRTFSLAGRLRDEEVWETDIWTALLRGWSETDLDPIQWQEVFGVLTPAIRLHTHPDMDLFLEKIVTRQASGLPLSVLGQAEEISLNCFRAVQEQEQALSGEESWLARALDSPAGHVAGFWLHALSLRIRHSQTRVDKLPEWYRDLFDEVIDAPSEAGQLARVVLCSQVNFLYATDQHWTKKKLIVCFDWDKDALRAEQAWHGFLTWGRIPPPLQEQFAELFVSTAQHLAGRSDGLRGRITEYAAGTALLLTGRDFDVCAWLIRLFRAFSNSERVGFWRHITFSLKQAGPVLTVAAWDAWIAEFWAKRKDGVPDRMTSEEVFGCVDLIPYVADRFPGAVSLALTADTPGQAHTFLYRHLAKTDLPEKYPLEFLRLFLHLLKKVDAQSIFDPDHMVDLFRRLALKLSAVELRALREEFVRLGLSAPLSTEN